jgi:hypothetical protein
MKGPEAIPALFILFFIQIWELKICQAELVEAG